MPFVHTASFRVRHYECDRDERVHPANYLRYMQEAAFEASARVGFTPARYVEIGYWWLAYETDIEYLAPLRYNDSFEIKTWVVDFRRVRSLRRYEFYRDGALIARASTDWVLIDMQTLQPATIPQEIIAAYAQGENVQPAPPRTKQLPQSAPPEEVFSMRRQAQWSEIDAAQHVNNAVYLNYVTDCCIQAQQVYGWSDRRLREAGVELVTRRHQIEYKAAITLGDDVAVSTWFSGIQPAAAVQHVIIKRVSDGKLVARVRALVACVHPSTRADVNFPPNFWDEFKAKTN